MSNGKVKHWIITNRQVQGERVTDSTVVSPSFRIAQFAPLAKPSVGAADAEAAVTLIPDEAVDDYKDVKADADPKSLAASKRLFLQLYKEMRDAPKEKGDVLFFIHGYNYSWSESLVHLQKLHEVYVDPDESPIRQIIYFSWPSHGDTLKYKADQPNAIQSGWLLGRVFGKALRFYADFFGRKRGAPVFCGKRIHIAAHSMGNQVLRHFATAINPYAMYRVPIIGEVLLLHADLEWNALEHDQPLHQLPEYCERIHVYNSFSDDALLISETTKNTEKRLGRHGPRNLDDLPPRTIVVDCTSASSTTVAGRADPSLRRAESILKKTNVIGKLREKVADHWGYLYRSSVVADIYRVLRGVSSGAEGSGRQKVRERLYRLS